MLTLMLIWPEVIGDAETLGMTTSMSTIKLYVNVLRRE